MTVMSHATRVLYAAAGQPHYPAPPTCPLGQPPHAQSDK
jgi:hypothetical protein